MATVATRGDSKLIKRRSSTRNQKRAAKAVSSSSANAVFKIADNKGRVVLGGEFANRPVIIEKLDDGEVVVKVARVIPERESWLYENPVALSAVRAGLAHARAGKLTSGPDLDADARFVAELED